jgi:hypothetical protein
VEKASTYVFAGRLIRTAEDIVDNGHRDFERAMGMNPEMGKMRELIAISIATSTLGR